MPYELRLAGRAPAVFETEAEAMAAARQRLADDIGAEPEVIDLATGKPCAPGASAGWREEFKGKVGF